MMGNERLSKLQLYANEKPVRFDCLFSHAKAHLICFTFQYNQLEKVHVPFNNVYVTELNLLKLL